jgi:signal transduction histidine kinase
LTAHVEPDNVVISVKDHGGGIPDLIVDRIFDPFFTTRESGLGLGLTVARQIMAAHRGTIAVDKLPEKGTSVSVVLPLHPLHRHEHGPHTDS